MIDKRFAIMGIIGVFVFVYSISDIKSIIEPEIEPLKTENVFKTKRVSNRYTVLGARTEKEEEIVQEGEMRVKFNINGLSDEMMVIKSDEMSSALSVGQLKLAEYDKLLFTFSGNNSEMIELLSNQVIKDGEEYEIELQIVNDNMQLFINGEIDRSLDFDTNYTLNNFMLVEVYDTWIGEGVEDLDIR
jgi:hypothetical protein